MTGVTVRTLESVGRCRADTRFMFVIVSSGWCLVLLQSPKYVTVSGDNMSSVQVLHHSKLIVVYRRSFNCNYIPAFATRVSGVLSVYPRMGGHKNYSDREIRYFGCVKVEFSIERKKKGCNFVCRDEVCDGPREHGNTLSDCTMGNWAATNWILRWILGRVRSNVK